MTRDDSRARRPNRLLATAARGALTGLAANFALLAVAAAVPTPAPTATPKALDTIVVTAQRHPTELKQTPREVYVVEAADLERLGARTVADALRYLPGVSVAQYGNAGQLETVSLRGAGSAQTLVLLDGRPVNEPDTGLTDFASIGVFNVSRVEVVEGGASTLYGSSAVGGVINIITRRPQSGRTVSSGYAEYGYEGAFDGGLSVSAGDPRIFSALVSARQLRGPNTYDYPPFLGAAGGTRINDDVRLSDASVALSREIKAARADLRLNADDSDVGSPGDVTCCLSALARQQRSVRRADLSVEMPLGLGVLSLQGYVDSRRLHFFDPTPPYGYDTMTTALSRGLMLRGTFAAGGDQTLTLGYDIRGDDAVFAASYYLHATQVGAASSALYAQDELRRPNAPFSLALGLRKEHPQGTQAPTTPSLGAVERVGRRLTLRANYGRAFRVPSLDERYFPSYGRPTLQPEYAATFDCGAALDFGRGDVSLTYFGEDADNLIVSLPVDSVGDEAPFNVGRARVRGLDAEIRDRLGASTNARLSVTSLLSAADLIDDRPLPYRPAFSASLNAWHALGGGEYGLGARLVGRRLAPSSGGMVPLPAYALGEAYFTRNVGRAKATVRFENIGGTHAEEDVLGYPVLGPTVSLRLSYGV
ncbi:MAG: TonB-dependent receptor [Candidatus Eremiobacteraeota bacterium]|nr:TonB-dependent receptor [Candidatus Eremiobacteraeota bacterium]